jgi:hypothetical protein
MTKDMSLVTAASSLTSNEVKSPFLLAYPTPLREIASWLSSENVLTTSDFASYPFTAVRRDRRVPVHDPLN